MFDLFVFTFVTLNFYIGNFVTQMSILVGNVNALTLQERPLGVTTDL